jgi:chemotaxis methyl-accepting protein methylase
MLGQHDLLESSKITFDCLRAMNVLNKAYFSADQMQVILHNVHQSLVDNGLLVLGSNQDAGSPVSGAVFAKTGSGFSRVWATTEELDVSEHIRSFNSRFS